MSAYLVWSNEHRAWWRQNGSGYTQDVWTAGRYDEAQAIEACTRRSWEPGRPPPEVKVLAPESGQDTFTVADIQAIPEQMQARVKEATRAAIRERRARRAAARHA
jgi:hypothetical protein